jgi:uncharacterized protein
VPPDERSDPQQERQAIQLLVVTVQGGLVVAAWLLGWLLDRPPFPMVVWSWWDAFLGIVLALPLITIGLVLLRWPIGPFAKIRTFTIEILVPLLASCTLLDLVCISLLAGVGEEMLFRGVMQTYFIDTFGLVEGLLLASALFGIMHAATVTYALFAGLVGLYLGLFYRWTDNLLGPILCHALYDLALLWYLLFGPGMPPKLREARRLADQQEDWQPEGDDS